MRTVVACSMLATSLASAGTFQFQAYTNNSGTSDQIDTSVTISADASTVTFTLNNNTSQGRVDIFYIEMGAALAGVDAGSAVIDNSDPGVNFATGGTPDDPEGGILSWAGNFFRMSATTPQPAANGLSFGETVSVTFSHDGTFSLAAFSAAVGNGTIRMVQHYLGWGPGGNNSEWLVTVPIPPAAWAGLATLGVLGGLRAAKRRHR